MNDAHNPYAPPSARLDGVESTSGVWRVGKQIVHVELGSDLPPRCVRCNAPALTPARTRKLYWHPGIVYVLFLFYIIPYLLVAPLVQRRFDVSPGLCRKHSASRGRLIVVAWILFAITAALWWYGMTGRGEMVPVFGFLTFLAAAIVTARVMRIVYPIRITQDYATLKGFGRPFLDSLPVA